ncbi:UvrD-helicase domain-containing protein [Candidatus Poribacteria bacterium]|nr:UvrD-helicase domain-containing protein [Candidatus Poribacteria bacterium]
MNLDKNQEKAVNHFTGPAIVVAGPGSGKTAVVTARILNLIQTHNIPPSKILAIAFNRKAVEEMENRIVRGLTSKGTLPVIRTLHAFGKDIITQNYKQAGFEHHPEIWSGEINKIIAEEKGQIDQKAAITKVSIYKIENKLTGKCYIGQSTNPERRRREHFSHSSNDRLRQAIRSEGELQFTFKVLEQVEGREANRREAYWIRHHRNCGEVFNRADPMREQFSNQVLLEMFCQHFSIQYTDHLDRDPDFENLRDRFYDIKDIVMRAKRQVESGIFDPNTLQNPVAREFAKKYEDQKSAANAIDFEDMIIYAAHLLETHSNIRQTYQDRYLYVLVDEFQDIAPIDFRLISQLSENLFAVGDDDQAIYSFRGGDSQIMQKFSNRSDVKKYEITRNYRSTSTIVEHARAIIERNKPRIRKNLRSHNPIKKEIGIIETTPETIKKYLLQQLSDVVETAILVRTNYEVDRIEEILSSESLSFSIEVTTIHKAKGREWEKVILVHNTLDRKFPRRDTILEEERRVFYVAMTRAKEQLVILGGTCQFVPECKNIPKNIRYYYRQFVYWWVRRKLKKLET